VAIYSREEIVVAMLKRIFLKVCRLRILYVALAAAYIAMAFGAAATAAYAVVGLVYMLIALRE